MTWGQQHGFEWGERPAPVIRRDYLVKGNIALRASGRVLPSGQLVSIEFQGFAELEGVKKVSFSVAPGQTLAVSVPLKDANFNYFTVITADKFSVNGDLTYQIYDLTTPVVVLDHAHFYFGSGMMKLLASFDGKVEKVRVTNNKAEDVLISVLVGRDATLADT